MPNYSGVWSLPAVYQAVAQENWPGQPNPIGVFGGGENNALSPKPQNIIDYINISSTGNATDFGDLSSAAYGLAGCSSSTRGLFGGLNTGSVTNIIEYITIRTTGNSTDFGDLTVARYYLASLSSSTRGVWAGGYTSGGYLAGNQNVIDYVTIATTGNATDFGDLGVGGVYQPAGCASPTRGLIGCGLDTSGTVISTQYITIASTGNSLTFGTLSVSRDNAGACSSSTRGLFGGGGIYSNVIDYYTIASTGNATDFGDLTVARNSLAGTSSSTRGVFGGGYTGSDSNVIDYVTIESTGNATDFGDLTSVRSNLAACSTAHGGL